MGRVTFQDRKIQDLVKQRFVPMWANSTRVFFGRELKRGDEDLTPLFAKWWPDGRAATRVKTAVYLPSGELVHVVPGFVKARLLERELTFALSVADAVSKEADHEAKKKAFRAAHKERLEALEKRWGPIDATMPLDTDRLLPDELRPDYYAQFLMRIHQSFAEHGTVEVKQDAPPTGFRPAKHGLVGGTGQVYAPTEEELAQARALVQLEKDVTTAIAGDKAAIETVRKGGTRAYAALVEALDDPARVKATCALLKALTGQALGDDVDAWTQWLCKSWRAPGE